MAQEVPDFLSPPGNIKPYSSTYDISRVMFWQRADALARRTADSLTSGPAFPGNPAIPGGPTEPYKMW